MQTLQATYPLLNSCLPTLTSPVPSLGPFLGTLGLQHTQQPLDFLRSNLPQVQ